MRSVRVSVSVAADVACRLVGLGALGCLGCTSSLRARQRAQSRQHAVAPLPHSAPCPFPNSKLPQPALLRTRPSRLTARSPCATSCPPTCASLW